MDRGLYFEEFEIGREYVSAGRTVTDDDITRFSEISGDYHPLHVDREYAISKGYPDRIGQGALTFAISTGFCFQEGLTLGTSFGMLSIEIKFRKPLMAGDTVHQVTSCTGKRETSKPDRGVVYLHRNIVNQDGDIIAEHVYTMMIKRRPAEQG